MPTVRLVAQQFVQLHVPADSDDRPAVCRFGRSVKDETGSEVNEHGGPLSPLRQPVLRKRDDLGEQSRDPVRRINGVIAP